MSEGGREGVIMSKLIIMLVNVSVSVFLYKRCVCVVPVRCCGLG